MGRLRFSSLIGLAGAGLLALALAGCGGSDGGSDSKGDAELPPTVDTGPGALAASTALTIRMDGATVDHRPVVEFTVTNEAGKGMTGLTAADLRFNIAKLLPASNGEPSAWQNYINVARSGVVQASQERSSTTFGTLTGLGSGRYRYTFATDITDPAANPCPAPCTGAYGQPLDLSYQAGLTHRVTVQQANNAYPLATGVLDFVPAGGAQVVGRDIVATETCNSCHAQLSAHGTRTDTRLCVTCHNPGLGAPATSAALDFKVMAHRIHYNNGGKALPSVLAGASNLLGATDFSAVTFPQDVRNCTRCHDGNGGNALATATAQGNHWKTTPSKEACGACHDDMHFGSAPDAVRTRPHPGGVIGDNSTCASCHTEGKEGDIVVAHGLPARLKAAAERFRFNILSVANTAPGSAPTVVFSVTDPTRGDAPYDIKTDPAFTTAGVSSLALKFGWSTGDIGNAGNGMSFGQPLTVNALTAATAGAVAGTFTVNAPGAVPAGTTGSMRVTMEGHPAGDVTKAGVFGDQLRVKMAFKDAIVTGASVVARRNVVDIAKCNTCHDTLSLHGNNRTDEPQACAVCHNPNATDASRRPATGGMLTGGIDGLLEESIDFKRMIHGIHAGGFRNKGLVIYGFGGSVNDFSGVVFPGQLKNCATCHTGDSYRLGGIWAAPVGNGILGSTISSGSTPADAADNLRISPTAAVCSSCHDGTTAKAHMQDAFNGGLFSATQATLQAIDGENCAFCHGAGRAVDVKTAHGVK